MSDVKDPKIKLFGKTIGLPETSLGAAAAGEAGGAGEDDSNKDPSCSSDSMMGDNNFVGDSEEQESDKSLLNPKQTDAKEDSQKSKESKESNANSHSKTLSSESDAEAVRTSKTEKEQTDTSNSQDKTLKKPDKIVPCPRCNSMETKFCYFNNYNVNQPRHFCKKCQRYWTAGGTMRNVPVGAGRRKNKHAASHFRLPEALQNGIHLNPNGTVLAFSSDTSLSDSMASALNTSDKTIQNAAHRPDELKVPVSYRSKENRDDRLNGSSFTSTISKDETGQPSPLPNYHPFSQSGPCFPGAPWPYPWNWNSPVSPTTFGNPSFPLPFYPTGGPYYCAMPGPWAVPWVIPAPSSGPMDTSLGPNSPTLGKHSRDDNATKGEDTRREGNSGKCLWIPKTLRIDDPTEAAKSSIWETLGIKHERVNKVGGRGGIFKVFGSQSKGDEKMPVPETSMILQANPAALCRSHNFHESS